MDTDKRTMCFLEVEENHVGDNLAMIVRTDFKLSIHEFESEFRNSVPSVR